MNELWDAELKLPADSDIAEILVYKDSLILLDERQGVLREVAKGTGNILSEFKLPRGGKAVYEGITIVERLGKPASIIMVYEPTGIIVFDLTTSE